MTPEILLEDGPLIATNKPAGLLTQGVPNGLPSLESWVKQYLKEKYQKPGNVYLGVPHRLDRPVSGIVVFARNSKAAARLAEQFRDRTVQKTYLAVTQHVPHPSEGRLTDWLLKNAEQAHVSVVDSKTTGARQAILDYQVIEEQAGRALVRVQLHTGRMHQIRVQLGSRDWPIVGDSQYGSTPPTSQFTDGSLPTTSAIALHAWQLRLFHPIRYDEINLQANPPNDWRHFGFRFPSEIF